MHRIATNPDDSTIVSAIICMGKNLKHTVVAEGIKTHEQKAHLLAQLCAEGQGFLFSRPVIADSFAQFLRPGIHEAAYQYSKSAQNEGA